MAVNVYVDKTAPTCTISAYSAASYAAYSCTDSGSGISSTKHKRNTATSLTVSDFASTTAGKSYTTAVSSTGTITSSYTCSGSYYFYILATDAVGNQSITRSSSNPGC